jgi:hypothetical protein
MVWLLSLPKLLVCCFDFALSLQHQAEGMVRRRIIGHELKHTA